MKTITTCSVLFVVLFATCISARAEIIQDPYLRFLSEANHMAEDNVLSFTVNFDGEKQLLFISLTSLDDGKAGNIWQGFEQTEDGFIALGKPISFRRDTLAFTTIDGIEGQALITYWPINAASGGLRTIQIEDDQIIEHDLGQIEPTGRDRQLYSDLFLNPTIKVAIAKRPVGELLKSLASQNTVVEDVDSMEFYSERSSIGSNADAGPNSVNSQEALNSDIAEQAQPATAKSWISFSLSVSVIACLLLIGVKFIHTIK